MSSIKTRRGLDLPIHGAATGSAIHDKIPPTRVALLPQESLGIKVKMLVQAGDRVRLGQALYCDRRDEAAVYGSPAGGRVAAVHRGARRMVHSVVVEVDGKEEATDFQPLVPSDVEPAAVRKALLASGFWGCLRQRPFDKVPHSESKPRALLVTAIDTRPLAPRPLDILAGRQDHFRAGLAVLARLVEGPTWLCTAAGEDWSGWTSPGVQIQPFAGPHPAGLPGFHIHKLAPVGAGHETWYIGYQDVADIGQLFTTGKFPTRRVVALTGPAAREPRLVATRRGADISQLGEGEYEADEVRALSGSVLDGRITAPGGPEGFLGRYAAQVAFLEDRTHRELLTWALPVAGRFSASNTILDKFFRKRFKFDTDENGGKRAIVPIGNYEEVMPLDVLPTQLIKALAAGDLEMAEKLGALELAEEDLALCQYVDPSKQPLTDWLRDMLNRIESEG